MPEDMMLYYLEQALERLNEHRFVSDEVEKHYAKITEEFEKFIAIYHLERGTINTLLDEILERE